MAHISKRIVGFATVAALTAGAVQRNTGSNGEVRSPTAASSLNNLSPLHQATIIAQRFRNSKSDDELRQAEELWEELRPGITKFENSLQCKDYGASHDKDIAIGIVGDLVNKPVELYLDIGKLIFAFAGGEKDETLEALKDAAKELAKDKAEDKLKDAARKVLVHDSGARFREALLKYLQSKSVRSRKYFLKIITDVVGIAKAYGGIALKVTEVALTPSRIDPEECGLGAWVDKERSEAIGRVLRRSGDQQPQPTFRKL
jgi:hypothetical protein